MKTLKLWLQRNAIFSALSGLSLVIANSQLQLFFGIEIGYLLPVIGVNLLLFASFVWMVSYRYIHQLKLVQIIIILDLIWVLASVFIILLEPFEISSASYWVITIVAIIVGFLGFQQYRNS